ncbi:MAG: hypothetical protein KGZ88_23340 [Methylomicrobium sp.]|nr:hypothetical protein [Methylomicrobium sp.]
MLQQQCLSGRACPGQGMPGDCRNPGHKDVFGARHPWLWISAIPAEMTILTKLIDLYNQVM